MEAGSHGHPQSFQVAVTVVLEQLKREELKKQKKRGLKHTFASYAMPSASHPFVIMSNRVVKQKPARSIYNVVSC
jgi:hypothetical protein